LETLALARPVGRYIAAKESEMTTREIRPDRLSGFSDGVFAVIITILVLELKPPHSPSFAALISLWPTALSYAVSYPFIAIVWINHHHLFRYADVATGRLIWGNFAHLFAVSFMPISTAWIAQNRPCGHPRFALRERLRRGECDVSSLVSGGHRSASKQGTAAPRD
jgi:uncharacterized membrane protein